MRIIIFISATFFFGNTFCSLVVSETGISIPKELFFKIFENIAPNLLVPRHPKEIQYQDDALKKFRLVCSAWRNILDTRVDFGCMMRLFVNNNVWSHAKCFRNLDFRWSQLKNSYSTENQWLIDQKSKRYTAIEELFLNDKKTDLGDNVSKSLGNIWSFYYRKVMKLKLKTYKYDGLVMPKKYILSGGFLSTNSFTKSVSKFIMFVEHFSYKSQDYKFLKKIVTMCGMTDVFSRLFEKFIRRDKNYCLSLLKQETQIDYRRFLRMMHLSFCKRVESYEYNINFCSQGQMFSIPHFFNLYKSSFTLKDQNNRSFLYYLLLYSKDNFFRIQAILLVSFIKGIEKKLSDYSEDEIIVYRKLFEKNFLYRLSKFLSDNHEQYLKSYFGVPF